MGPKEQPPKNPDDRREPPSPAKVPSEMPPRKPEVDDIDIDKDPGYRQPIDPEIRNPRRERSLRIFSV